MTPQQEPPTPEEMQAAREALRESTAEMASAASGSLFTRSDEAVGEHAVSGSGEHEALNPSEPRPVSSAAKAHTEESMLALLAARYRQTSGNGPAWAFVPKVRNAAGFQATRTIDAIAMSLWPSRGLEIHGHEIKVSRSDWLRELKNPAKAEAFTDLCDRWWVVVSDAKIVAPGELPPTWGLMVARGRGLRVLVEAPELPPTDAQWMPRTFLAALLRAAVRTKEVTPAEVEAAVTGARAEWDERHRENIEGWRESRDELRARICAFEEASGIRLADAYGREDRAAEIGRAVRLVLDGDVTVERYERRLLSLAEQAERLAGELRIVTGQEGSRAAA